MDSTAYHGSGRIWIYPRPTILALIGAPFIGMGGLAVASVIRQGAIALVTGAYSATPSLVGSHLVALLGCAIFLCLGLLMAFGGTYGLVDPERRRVTALGFYGFFVRWARADFADVAQVILRAESTRPHSRGVRRRDGIRYYHTYHLIELELRGGGRVLLEKGRDKAQIHGRGARIAGLVRVPTLDLGLVGQPYNQLLDTSWKGRTR